MFSSALPTIFCDGPLQPAKLIKHLQIELTQRRYLTLTVSVDQAVASHF
jgi:hypothetical protein